MRFDTIIKGGNLVFPAKEVAQLDIGIIDGKIASIHKADLYDEAENIVYAKGKYVFPGAIDPHTHIGIYNPWDEDFKSETRFAACGGITTVVNYFRKKGDYTSFIPEMIEKAEENSTVDFGIHLGLLTKEHVENIGKYGEELGVSSYKIYTNYMGRVKELFDTEDGLNLDDGDLDYIFSLLGSKHKDVRLCVHCENMEVTRKVMSEIDMSKAGTLEFHEKLSPGYAEAQSVMSTLYFAKRYGAKSYIVHVSSGETTELLRDTKGVFDENTFIETCPHYLYQDVDSEWGILGKVNPPIRDAENSKVLWDALKDGTITSFGSDHCAIGLDKKGEGAQAKPGFPSFGLSLPILISEGYHKREVPLTKIAEIISLNPAKAFNLFNKGDIKVGYDADFAILDIDKTWTVDSDKLEGSSDFSIYNGRELKGKVETTILRGEIIVENGEITGSPKGKYIRRYKG